MASPEAKTTKPATCKVMSIGSATMFSVLSENEFVLGACHKHQGLSGIAVALNLDRPVLALTEDQKAGEGLALHVFEDDICIEAEVGTDFLGNEADDFAHGRTPQMRSNFRSSASALAFSSAVIASIWAMDGGLASKAAQWLDLTV
jgi:hypothetical protein